MRWQAWQRLLMLHFGTWGLWALFLELGLPLFLIRIWVTEKSSVDHVPCLLHKYFLAWFQVSLSLGGSAMEGLKRLVIQSLGCQRCWRTCGILDLHSFPHSHSPLGWNGEPGQWNPMPEPEWLGFSVVLFVLFSDPKTALPLPELKCGEKGKEQRKAVTGKRWIDGKNRCVEAGREGSPEVGECGDAHVLHAPLSPWHFHALCSPVTRGACYFSSKHNKATSSFRFEISASWRRKYFAKIYKHGLL